jgi:NAD-dependent deacetylase
LYNPIQSILTVIPPNLVQELLRARHVVCFTGAGVSAESGVPTFRDAQGGFWQHYRPEDLATPEGFRRNPKLVWDWYAWRRQQLQQVKPNPGHLALAALEPHFASLTIVTQNIDSLHQRAGSQRVLELHGNLSHTKCFDEDRRVESWEPSEDSPPRCPHCQGYLRPDVVWFGEQLPQAVFEAALQASRRADMFFAIGTSALVYPAAALPYEAVAAGATLVEVNPQPTPMSGEAHHVLRGPSGEVLAELLAAFTEARQIHT